MKNTRHDTLYPSAKQPFWGRLQSFARPTSIEDAGYGVSANPDAEEHNYLFQVLADWSSYLDNNSRQIQPDVVVGSAVSGRVTHTEADFVSAALAGYNVLFVSGIVFTAARLLLNQVVIGMDSPDAEIDIDTFDFTLKEVSGYIGITTNGGKLILNGVTHGLIVRGAVTVKEGPLFSGSYYLNGVLHSPSQDIQFLNEPDMVVMTSAELDNYSNDPKFVKYNFTTKLFETREGDARVPVTGDWSIIKSIEAMTDDLEFPETYHRPKIETERHFQIPTGAGSYPFPIYVRGSGGECSFITDKTFAQLVALQAGTLPTAGELKSQQYIKNRGESNKILVNNQQIYSGDRPRDIEFPAQIIHPYVFPHNGYSFHGVAEIGTNDDETLLIDAWKAWGGIDLVGDGSILLSPNSNPFAASGFLYKIYMPDGAGYFTRPATQFGGTGGVDPDIHSRTSPNGNETLTSGNYTSSAEAIIKDISDANIVKFKLLSRLQATGLPSSASFTTLISKIVRNAADDNWIYLIDSETGLPVSVSATGDLTIDMGGNSGISLQLDSMQNHWHDVKQTGAGGVSTVAIGSPAAYSGLRADDFIGDPKTDGVSTPRTSIQTRPTSKQRYNYTLP